ncbi:MAG TPA: DUF507 family protein [Pseudobdellovibrionaceae bacterium]|nr:DUF507 family protein [Pseudobdellovibrionaceae bacterium]
MKLNTNQIEHLVDLIIRSWKNNRVIEFKVDEPKVRQRMIQLVRGEYDKEANLEKEVNKMLDDLERSHGGEFQRHKMYHMLKQKLAKERKVIL